MKKHSLTSKIWKYLVLFSLAILLFLWLFQVIFINKYYEWTKTRHIKQIAQELLTSDTATSIYETLDRISYQENISIEITTADGNGLYASNGNFNLFNDINTFKYQFIESGLSDYTYIFENPRFKDKSITYAVKLNNNLFAFISTSLEPIDSTVKILQEQLLIVTGIVLILSFMIAYFISRYLSKPIIKISNAASRIAAGKMNTTFESDSDISELIALTDALNEMKTELSKTEELQRDLIANVSHDLKTPLTMIKAYAELVRDINYKQKDKREENLNIIIAEVDRMTLLVNDILTLSKMQVALDTLELETFDFIALVQDIINRFMIFAKKDGYRILFEHTSLTSVIIEADKKKLEISFEEYEYKEYRSFKFIIKSNVGISHDIEEVFTVNFKGDTVIDINYFKQKNKDILDLFYSECYNKLKDDTNIKQYSSEEWLNKGLQKDPDNYKNFIFTENSLIIIFNSYTIAPYVAGIFEVEIPYDNLNLILDN